jgi:hypothetical protein
MHSFELIDQIPEKVYRKKLLWGRAVLIVYLLLSAFLIGEILWDLWKDGQVEWRSIIRLVLILCLFVFNTKDFFSPNRFRKKVLVNMDTIEVEYPNQSRLFMFWKDIAKVQMGFNNVRLFSDSNQYDEFDISSLTSSEKKTLRTTIYHLAQEKQVPVELPSAIKDNLLQ